MVSLWFGSVLKQRRPWNDCWTGELRVVKELSRAKDLELRQLQLRVKAREGGESVCVCVCVCV